MPSGYNADEIKKVVKDLKKTAIAAIAVAPFLPSVLASALIAIAPPKDNENLKLAESINQYYAYLAQDTNPLDTHQIFAYQSALSAMGYDELLGQCGIDGLEGPAFHRAIRAFQRDHDLYEYADLSVKTKEAIAQSIANDPALEKDLHEMLITPFQNGIAAEIIEQKDAYFSAVNRYGVAWTRPDVLLTAAWADSTGFIEENTKELHAAFEHCSDNRYYDAMRHSAMVVRLADLPLIPTQTAITVGNFREYATDNPTPSRLSDIINHAIAGARYNEFTEAGLEYDSTKIIADIRAGKYILQPIPMVDNDFDFAPTAPAATADLD